MLATLMISSVVGFGAAVTLSTPSPVGATTTSNDHVWNNSASFTLCGYCSGTEYVNAWLNTYPAPTTLNVIGYDMNLYNGSGGVDNGVDTDGAGSASALNYNGWWWAAALVDSFTSATSYPDLQYMFANGT